MKVGELLERRRDNWRELEKLCETLQTKRLRRIPPADVARFTSLYRAACADLALADSYQLPPVTVDYLHRLVGQAHNQLYRTRNFDTGSWAKLLVDTPRQIFRDGCVQLAFCLFWGVFILSAFCAQAENLWPGYAEQLLSAGMIEQLEIVSVSRFGSRSDAELPHGGILYSAQHEYRPEVFCGRSARHSRYLHHDVQRGRSRGQFRLHGSSRGPGRRELLPFCHGPWPV
jgi:hypothetical protein